MLKFSEKGTLVYHIDQEEFRPFLQSDFTRVIVPASNLAYVVAAVELTFIVNTFHYLGPQFKLE